MIVDNEICRIAAPTFAVFAVLCGNSTGISELIVGGLPANVGIGIVPLFCLSSLVNKVPVPVACGTDPRSLCDAPECIP